MTKPKNCLLTVIKKNNQKVNKTHKNSRKKIKKIRKIVIFNKKYLKKKKKCRKPTTGIDPVTFCLRGRYNNHYAMPALVN